MNPEFIIRIIVRARNEIAGVLEKAAGDVEKLTKAQDKGSSAEKRRADATKNTAKSIEDVTRRFEAYTKELEAGTRTGDAAEKQLKSFGREFDRLGNRVKAGSQAADTLYQLGQRAKQLSDEVKKASADAAKADRDRAQSAKQTAAQIAAARKAEANAVIAEVRRELKADADARKAFNTELDRGEVAYRRRIRTIQEGREAVAAAAEKEARASSEAAAQAARADLVRIERQRQLQLEIAKTVRAQQRARTEAERDISRRALSGQAQQLRDLGVDDRTVRRTLTRAYTDQDSDDVALTRRQARIQRLAQAQRDLANMPAPRQGFLQRLFNIDEGKLDSINNRIRDFEVHANRSSFSAVKLAGNIRGMVIVGAIAFFQQLVGVGVALGGTLVSVASAAVQAGGALAGALTAGAAQALPILGLLGAAWGRVGAVFDVLKKSQQARLADDAAVSRSAVDQASKADALASAQEGLAEAHRRVAEAQEGLNDARFQAVRQIEDLVAAERQAQLQAESAALAQADAQLALRRSISGGDVDNLAQNALQARSTMFQRLQAGVAAGRASYDAARATRGGVEGMPGVVQARKALDDANRGVRSAQRSLDAAKRSAEGAAEATNSTRRMLEAMLAQLSPAERRLYDALERVQKRYKAAFTGEGGVLEPIIESFSRAADRVYEILGDPRFIAAATALSGAVAGQLDRIVDALSSPETIEFFTEMGRQAAINLPIFVDILGGIGEFLRTVAEAGGPALTRILGDLSDFVGAANDSTGVEKLQAFFDRGVIYAESFGRLGIALAQLFGAVIGASADEGMSAIDSLTDQVQKATDYIHKNQDEVQQFFEDARVATGYVLEAVWDLSKALFSLFHEEQVEAFAEAFRETLLPALMDVLRVMGAVARIFLEIAGTDVGGSLVRLALTAFLLQKALGPVVRFLGGMVLTLGRLFTSVRLAGIGLGIMRMATGPVGSAIAILSAAFLVMSGRIDSVGDALRELTPIIGGLVGVLIARNGLSGALGLLSGVLGKIPGLGKLITKIPGLGGAAAGAAGAGAGAAEAAGGGAAVSGALRTGAMGLLKKAGWIGVGISAGQGILDGFRSGSVTTGLRSFFHSVSFGLIDSAEQQAAKAARKINRILQRDVAPARTPGARVEGLPTMPLPSAQAIPRGPSGAPIPGARTPGRTEFERYYDKLKDNQKVAVNTILRLREELGELSRDKSSRIFFDSFYSRLTEFAKTAPPEFRDAIKDMVDDAKKQKERLDRIFKPREIAGNIATDFGIKLQGEGANIEKVTDGLIDKIRPLPAKTKALAVRAAIDMAKGLEERGQIPEGAAQKIRDDVVQAYDQMRRRAARRAAGTASDTAIAMTAISNVVAIRMKGMVTSVNSVLKSLGFSGIKLPKNISAEDASSGANKAGQILGSILGGSAEGGFIKGKGHRGGDVIPRMVGAGEAVLNWGHQRVVEPAVRAYYGFGLDGVFKRVRGKHGWEFPGMGDAAGRRPRVTPNEGESGSRVGINVMGSKPGFAVFMEHFRRLFGRSLFVMSGFRGGSRVAGTGNVSNHASGNAIDISNPISQHGTQANPPPKNALDNLAAYISRHIPKPPRLDFLWRTMQGGNHFNHVHLGLSAAVTRTIGAARKFVENLSGARGSYKGIFSTSGGGADAAPGFDRLKTPNVPGRGPMSDIIRGLLGRVARAGNKKMEDSAGSGGGGGIPSFSGAWTSVMAKIAKAKDWSLAAWKTLVSKESGGDPTAVNPSSGAFGLGQFLGATKRAYAKYGATSKDPVRQIRAMAKYIADRYGSPSKALAFHLAHNWYEKGGPVGGDGPRPIMAHGGEHVWTAAEVARAGGHAAVRAMRKIFGGGAQGGPTSFAAGGEVKPYTQPLRHAMNVEGLLKELTTAQGIISDLPSRTITSKFTDALSTTFKAVLGDGGLLDQMTDAITALSDRLARSLKQATFKLDKAGNVIRGLDDVGVADRTVENLVAVRTALNEQQAEIADALADVQKRLKSKSLSEGERNYLTGIRRNLSKRMGEVQIAIADNLESTYSAVSDQISARVTAASDKAGRGTGFLDYLQRGRDLVGGTFLGSTGAASNQSMGNRRASVLNTQANELASAAGFARSRGRGKEADEIMAQVAELRVSALEAVRDGLSKDVDEVNRQAGRTTTGLDIRGRIASALGRVGDTAQIAQERIAATNKQIGQLQDKQAEAARLGFFELAETIGDSIADLQASITEIAAQQLQESIEQINNAASRRGGQLDLRNRMADLQQAAGDFAGAFRARGETLVARGQNISAQRAGLTSLLNTAIAQGNQGAIDSLTDQIAELDVQLAENTAAIKANTVAARQAAIDRITGRGGFLGGVYGGLQSLVTALGELSGSIDTEAIRGLLVQAGTTLQQTGTGLTGQLFEGYGIDLRGMSPSELVAALSSINYDEVEANMTEEERAQFEALISAVIENATATVANTTQLQQLNAPQTQTWSSTAWSWFRNAVFDGAGGLLPQYNYSLGIGASASTAVAAPTAATSSMAADNASRSAGGDVFAPHVENHEITEDLDTETMVNRLYTRWRDRPEA